MSQINIDHVVEQSLELANDLLKGLRSSGFAVVDVSSLILESSSTFSSFLMSPQNPEDFERHLKALRWSCQSALALVEGYEKAQTSSLNKKEGLGVLSTQIDNLGQWKKFSQDMVTGAQGRLRLMEELEQGIIHKATKTSKPPPR